MSVFQFHNWRVCSECNPVPTAPWTGDLVLLDASDPSTTVPAGTPYGAMSIAMASHAVWLSYGSPSPGDIVKIHTDAMGSIPARDWCIEYIGFTVTQQNIHVEWSVAHNAQYIETVPGCMDCCRKFYEWQICSDCMAHPNTYTGVEE
jgi:hypothetical protein